MATSKEKLQIIVDAQGIAKTKAQLKAMDSATGGATKSFGLMATGIAGATVALYAMGKATSFAIRVSKEFEQGMANVKAISRATGAEFKALESNAKLLGRTTKFTATEVSGLQTEFAKLGFTTSEIQKVTKGTLALAAATGSDLATSAAVAVTTLRGFGLDASETGRVTDVMAKSFSSSALDMQKFTDSMKFVAPVAKMAGFSIEGTTAIMGQLANAGIDGSMAGTSLRKIFLELSNSSSKLSKRLGGSVSSVDELIPALQRLNAEGVTTAEMKDLVGQRAISAFSIMLSGSEDVDTLAESLRNAGGAAQEMADIQLDTLEGKMTIMNSAMEGLGIAIGDKLSPAIQGAVEGFTGLLGVMTDIITKGSQAFVKFDDMSDALSQAHISATQTRGEFKNLTDQLLHLARQTELSSDEEERRNGIIDELQKKYPNYLSNLDQEADDYMALTRSIASAKTSLEEYLNAQIKAATAEVFVKDIAKTRAEIIKLQANLEVLADPSRIAIFVKESGYVMDRAQATEFYSNKVNKLNMDLGILTTGYENASIEAERLSNVPPPSTDLIQFEEAQGPPLPPVVSEAPGPTTESMEIKLSELDEFYMAQHMLGIDAMALEEARLIEMAEEKGASEEEITAIEEIFSEKRKQIAAEEAQFKKDQIMEATQATLSVLGDAFGAMNDLAQAEMDIEMEKAKQRGATNEELEAIAKKHKDKMKGTKVAEATMNMFASAVAAFNSMVGIPFVGPVLAPIAAIAALASGVANIKKIQSAATGADFITSGPQMMMVGDNPGGREQVNVTPLSSPNTSGPQGGAVQISFSGNVMSDDFITEEAIPKIREAIRRGEEIA